MWVDREGKVTFLATPRTGSRAIAQWMKQQRGAVEVVHRGSMLGPWGSHHGFDLDKLRRQQGLGFTVFCTVRNHWDILVSWYYNRGKYQEGLKGFGPFVRDFPRTDPFGARFEMFWLFRRLADELVRYESMEMDLQRVFQLEERPRITVLGRSAHRLGDYHQYFDAHPGLAEWVFNQYRDEIEALGYEY